MFSIVKSNIKYEEYEISDPNSLTSMRIVPEKGGIITSLVFQGREMLYLDSEAFLEREELTAGGIPILFPICGTLNEDRYKAGGKVYDMESHGFAWKMPWKVLDMDSGAAGQITLGLSDTSFSQKLYPFKFEIRYKFTLGYNRLEIDQEYKNTGNVEMPFYSGFHPFFHTTRKQDVKITMDADEYLDYNTGCLEKYDGRLDLSRAVDNVYHLGSPGRNICSITGLHEDSGITIEMSEEYRYVVVWTVQGSNFVCVEPWMAAPDAMNTGESLSRILPGRSMKSAVRIGLI